MKWIYTELKWIIWFNTKSNTVEFLCWDWRRWWWWNCDVWGIFKFSQLLTLGRNRKGSNVWLWKDYGVLNWSQWLVGSFLFLLFWSIFDLRGTRCPLQTHTTGRLVLLKRKRRIWLTSWSETLAARRSITWSRCHHLVLCCFNFDC